MGCKDGLKIQLDGSFGLIYYFACVHGRIAFERPIL